MKLKFCVHSIDAEEFWEQKALSQKSGTEFAVWISFTRDPDIMRSHYDYYPRQNPYSNDWGWYKLKKIG